MAAKVRHLVLGTPNHDADKTVVILGVPRGGTSMVAGVVRELGIDLGPSLGVNHEDPEFLPQDVPIIRARIAERNATSGTWGWKMPHTTDYIDEIEQDLRNPHIIFVFRNVLGTALSQERHSGADIDVALRVSMQRLQTTVEKIGKLSSPMLLTDYDAALYDPAGFVGCLTSFLGLHPDEATRARALSFIDADQGYRQIAARYFRVSQDNGSNEGREIELTTRLRHLKRAENGDDFVRNGEKPGFIFAANGADGLPARLIFRFSNVSEDDQVVRFVFDFDGQFSGNMSQKMVASPGQNQFLVATNGNARRVCIIPPMIEGRSSIGGFQTYCVD